ncbi:MAG: carbohydrate-binding family 9-like protein [Bacteroidota bacterium]
MNLNSPILYSLICMFFLCVGCTSNRTDAEENSVSDPFSGLEHLFTTPKTYVVYKTSKPIEIDGAMDEADWAKAEWTDEFVDIEGSLKPDPYLPTKAKMLWDEENFYFAAELKDPHVWATLKNHDAVIFIDNDFEIFIDVDNDKHRSNYKYPDHDTHRYYEFEMNAFNTTWDLFLDKAYRDGGMALTSWEIKGLKTGAKVLGTINDPGDEDQGWTVEIAIPFSSIHYGPSGGSYAPSDGDQYRVNFSRVQYDMDIIDGKYVKQKDSTGKDLPCYNWVWSPQGVINMHFPERWGYAQFSIETVGTKTVPFIHHYPEKQKDYLWLVYYKQREWIRDHSQYAANLEDLGINNEVIIDGVKNTMEIEATSRQFIASIKSENDPTIWSIHQDGLVIQSAQE